MTDAEFNGLLSQVNQPESSPEQIGGDYEWAGAETTVPLGDLEGGREYLNTLLRYRAGERPGFVEGIGTWGKEQVFYIGDVLSAARMGKVAWTVRKMKRKEPIPDQDLLDLNRFLLDEAFQAKATIRGQAGRVIRDSFIFGVEIAGATLASSLTMGGSAAGLVKGKLVTKGVAKTAREAVLEYLLKKQIKKTVAVKVANIAAVGADLGFKTALYDAFRPGATMKNYQMRRIQSALTGDDETAMGAAISAIADTSVEHVTEFSGEFLGAGIAKLVPDAVKKKIAGTVVVSFLANKYNAPAVKRIAELGETIGYNGMAQEMLEERAGGFLRGLFGIAQGDTAGLASAIKGAIPTWEQLGVEALAFAIPSVAFTSYDYAKGGVSLADRAKNIETSIAATPEKGHSVVGKTISELADGVIAEEDPWHASSKHFKWLKYVPGWGPAKRGSIQDLLGERTAAELREASVKASREARAAFLEKIKKTDVDALAPDELLAMKKAEYDATREAISRTLDVQRKVHVIDTGDAVKDESEKETWEKAVAEGKIKVTTPEGESFFRVWKGREQTMFFVGDKELSEEDVAFLKEHYVVKILDIQTLNDGSFDSIPLTPEYLQPAPPDEDDGRSPEVRRIEFAKPLFRTTDGVEASRSLDILTAMVNRPGAQLEAMPLHTMLLATAEEMAEAGTLGEKSRAVFEKVSGKRVWNVNAWNRGGKVFLNLDGTPAGWFEDDLESVVKTRMGVDRGKVPEELQDVDAHWSKAIEEELSGKDLAPERRAVLKVLQGYDLNPATRFERLIKFFVYGRVMAGEGTGETDAIFQEMSQLPADLDEKLDRYMTETYGAATIAELRKISGYTPKGPTGAMRVVKEAIAGERPVGEARDVMKARQEHENKLVRDLASAIMTMDARKKDTWEKVDAAFNEILKVGVSFSTNEADWIKAETEWHDARSRGDRIGLQTALRKLHKATDEKSRIHTLFEKTFIHLRLGYHPSYLVSPPSQPYDPRYLERPEGFVPRQTTVSDIPLAPEPVPLSEFPEEVPVSQTIPPGAHVQPPTVAGPREMREPEGGSLRGDRYGPGMGYPMLSSAGRAVSAEDVLTAASDILALAPETLQYWADYFDVVTVPEIARMAISENPDILNRKARTVRREALTKRTDFGKETPVYAPEIVEYFQKEPVDITIPTPPRTQEDLEMSLQGVIKRLGIQLERTATGRAGRTMTVSEKRAMEVSDEGRIIVSEKTGEERPSEPYRGSVYDLHAKVAGLEETIADPNMAMLFEGRDVAPEEAEELRLLEEERGEGPISAEQRTAALAEMRDEEAMFERVKSARDWAEGIELRIKDFDSMPALDEETPIAKWLRFIMAIGGMGSQSLVERGKGKTVGGLVPDLHHAGYTRVKSYTRGGGIDPVTKKKLAGGTVFAMNAEQVRAITRWGRGVYSAFMKIRKGIIQSEIDGVIVLQDRSPESTEIAQQLPTYAAIEAAQTGSVPMAKVPINVKVFTPEEVYDRKITGGDWNKAKTKYYLRIPDFSQRVAEMQGPGGSQDYETVTGMPAAFRAVLVLDSSIITRENSDILADKVETFIRRNKIRGLAVMGIDAWDKKHERIVIPEYYGIIHKAMYKALTRAPVRVAEPVVLPATGEAKAVAQPSGVKPQVSPVKTGYTVMGNTITWDKVPDEAIRLTVERAENLPNATHIVKVSPEVERRLDEEKKELVIKKGVQAEAISNLMAAELKQRAEAPDIEFAKLPRVIPPLGKPVIEQPAAVAVEAPAPAPVRVILPGTSPYTAKDQAKSDKANKFIGRGSARSSTEAYRKAWGNRANTFNYESSDVVFVSTEGDRPGRERPAYDEIKRAVEVGATLITDVSADRLRAYNIGERDVAQFLTENGYVESKPGEWTPATPAPAAAPVKIVGLNISSYEIGLGNQLSNFTQMPITFRGKKYSSSEAAYQANKGTDLSDASVRSLMIEVITEKLKQYPDLVSQITDRGGMAFLSESSHNLIRAGKIVKSDRWTGKNGLFMQALREAYNTLIPAPTAPASVAAPVEIVGLNEPYDVKAMRGPAPGYRNMDTAGKEDYGKRDSGWLGNPVLWEGNGGPKGVTVQDAIEGFRKKFLAKIESDPDFKKAVEDLRGKRLGYYRPQAENHVTVIKEYLDKQSSATFSTLHERILTAMKRMENSRYLTPAIRSFYADRIGRALHGDDKMKRWVRSKLLFVDQQAFVGPLRTRDEEPYEPAPEAQPPAPIVPPPPAEEQLPLFPQPDAAIEDDRNITLSLNADEEIRVWRDYFFGGAYGMQRSLLRTKRLMNDALNLSKGEMRKLGERLDRKAMPDRFFEAVIYRLEKVAKVPGGEKGIAVSSILAEYDKARSKDSISAEDFVKIMRGHWDAGFEKINAVVAHLSDSAWVSYLDDYVTHWWLRSKGMSKEEFERLKGKLHEEARSAKERRIPTMDQGVKLGLEPVTWNPMELYAKWSRDIWKSARYRLFMNETAFTRDADGDVMAAPGQDAVLAEGVDRVLMPETYRELLETLSSQFKVPYNKMLDPETEYVRVFKSISATQWRDAGYERVDSPGTEQASFFWVKKGDPSNVLKMVVDRRWDKPWLMFISDWNQLGKAGMLLYSPFHPFSQFESFIAVFGLKGNPILKPWNWGKYYKSFMETSRMLKEHPELWSPWIMAGKGLVEQDPNVDMSRVDHLLRQGIARLPPGMAMAANKAMDAKKWWDDFIWGFLHPTMTYIAMEHSYNILKADYARTGRTWNDQQMRESIVRQINNGIGGQEWEQYLWATPKVLQGVHLAMFAPDWGLSNANIAGITALPGLREFIRPTFDATQWSLTRKYWWAMGFLVLAGIPNMLQTMIYAAFGDPDDDDRPFTFMNEEGKKTHVDFTPLLRRLPGYTGDETGKRRVYLRWGKQAYEVSGWFTDFFSTLMGKSSVVVRTAWEQATGTSTSGWTLPFKDKGFMGVLASNESFFEGRLGYATWQKFMPLSLIQLAKGQPVGFFAPASRGASNGGLIKKMQDVLATYADNGVWSKIHGNKNYETNLRNLVTGGLDAAERNGWDGEEIYTRARSLVLTKYYEKFWKALNDQNEGEMEDAARSIVRLHGTVKTVVASMKKRSKTASKSLEAEAASLSEEVIRQAERETIR